MNAIITFTAEPQLIDNTFYNYTGEDRILRNIINNDYEIFYSGQNQGRYDNLLIDAVNASATFRVYYRRRKGSPFIFVGSTNISSIIRERTSARGVSTEPNERLQIRLVIPSENVEDTQINTQYTGYGKYKKAVLEHSNFNINSNIQSGFYVQM